MNTYLSIFFGLGWMLILFLGTWSVVRKLLSVLSAGEKLATTVVFSIVLSSWIGFVSWYALGQQWGNVVLLALAGGSIGLDWGWYQKFLTPKKLTVVRLWLHDHPRALIIGTVLLCFLTLLTTRYALPMGTDGWYSSGPSWGDTPLHLALSSYFVQHGVRGLVLPLFPSVRLAYPFLVDLHSAQLFTITHSWQISLGIDTWLLLASLAYLIYRVGWRLSGSLVTSTVWSLLIFASGSAAGIFTYLQDLSQGFPAIMRDYSNLAAADPTTQQFFANLTTSHLLPQRTYLMGCAIFFSVLILLVAAYKKTSTKLAVRYEARLANFIAVLIGLSPFIHVHSFLVLALVLVLFCIARYNALRNIPWIWIRAGIIAMCIALPQLFWQFSSGYTSGFSHWQFGWLTAVDSNVVVFWIINLGLLVPTILWASWRRLRTDWRGDWMALLIIAGAILFLICNVYIFQPNEWDNMKLLTYGYIFLTLPVAVWFTKICQRGTIQRGAILFALLVILLPGTLSIYRQVTVTDRLFTSADIAVADFVKDNLEPDSVILTSSHHNNPISSLSGHKVALGYPGWLGSYGISYESVQQDTTEIWHNSTTSDKALARLKIGYIAFSDKEAAELETDATELNMRFQSIYDKDGWHIYRATQKPLDPTTPAQ